MPNDRRGFKRAFDEGAVIGRFVPRLLAQGIQASVNGQVLPSNRSEAINIRYVGGYIFGCSTGCHDRIFEPHFVEQVFNRSALRIGAANPDVPIAMGVGLRVSHDDFAKRPVPSLRVPTSFPDKASYKQMFKIGCRHTHRLAVVGGKSNRASRPSLTINCRS